MPLSRTRPFAQAARLAVLLGCVTAAGSACQLNFTDGIEARDRWTRSYELARGGSLEIRESNGRMTVEGVDGNRIEIVAERVGKGRTDEAAKQVLAGIEIKETVAPDRVVVDSTTRGPNLGIGTSRYVEYTVKVPRHARVSLHAANGNLEITGVLGKVDAVTTNGTIRASGLAEGGTFETTNGIVTVEAAGIGSGLRCESTNGVINVTIPSDAKADLSAQTTNGVITSSGLDLVVAEKTQRRLDGAIGGGGPSVRLRTTNGAIVLRGR